MPWTALGGTSGAAPLWAAVLAVVASANGNTAGYGQLNPALYLLAQQSPGTYLNDVTSGNNDYNATAGGQFPAMAGYDMATGLGTPVASALATGLTSMPLSVAVVGQPDLRRIADLHRFGQLRGNRDHALRRHPRQQRPHLHHRRDINDDRPGAWRRGRTRLLASSVQRTVLGGADANDYSVVYTTAGQRLHRGGHPGPCRSLGHPDLRGHSDLHGHATTRRRASPWTRRAGVHHAGLKTIGPTMPAGSYTLAPAGCSGATLSGVNATGYSVVYTTSTGDFTVTPAPLTITASSNSMPYGGTPPTITPGYSGFVNGRLRPLADDAADVLDHSDQLEPGAGHSVRLVLWWRGRPQLHDHLRRGFGDGHALRT